MKRYFFLIIILFMSVCSISIAEEGDVIEEELQILFPNSTVYGLVGGVESKVSWFSTKPALFVGGDLSWVIDHRFIFGAVHMQSVNNIAGADRKMNYAGVLIGYIGYPFRVLHGSVEFLTGAGNLHSDNTRSDDAFLVFEPGAKIQINLSDLVRVSIGASHRFTWYAQSLSDSKLNGTSLTMGISFGLF